MTTIFTQIINGEIPAYKVAETDDHLAFLDVYPIQRGHVLCIPKRENDYIFDLSDEELAKLMVFSKKVARAIDSVTPQKRVGVAVIGLEVPHTHIHLVPIDNVSDLSFANEKLSFSQNEMQEIADTIAEAYKKEA